jgi:polyferredoxin
MNPITKSKLSKRWLIAQLSIYAFIIVHSILWHVFHVHYLTKLCPAAFGNHIGNLEINFNVLFWVLIFISTLFVGRAFCAWGCMFGAYQDFVARAMKKLKIKPIQGKLKSWIFPLLIIVATVPFLAESKVAWPTLFWFMVIIFSSGLALWWFIEIKTGHRKIATIPKYLLLSHYLGTIVASWIVLNVFQKGISFAFHKYGVLDEYRTTAGIIFVLAGLSLTAFGVVIEKRLFCKYICPYGLLLRFLSVIPFSKRRLVQASGQCSQCAKCNKACPMGLDPMREINEHGKVTDPNCINCLQCVATCPKNAIDFTAQV